MENHLLPSTPLTQAVQQESERFQDYYLWLENTMPATFFKEVSPESLMLINHSLMGFAMQVFLYH